MRRTGRKRRSQKRFTEDDDNELLVVLKHLYKNYDSKRLSANWKEVQTELNGRLKNGKRFDVYQVNQHWLRVLSKKVDGNFQWKSPKKKRKLMEKRDEEVFLKEFKPLRKNRKKKKSPPPSPEKTLEVTIEMNKQRPIRKKVDLPYMWRPKYDNSNYFDNCFDFDILSYVAFSMFPQDPEPDDDVL